GRGVDGGLFHVGVGPDSLELAYAVQDVQDRPVEGVLLAFLLVEVLREAVDVGDGQGIDAIAVARRRVVGLQDAEYDGKVLRVDAALVPLGHHREDLPDDVPVRLDGREEEEGIGIADEGVDHPMVLDLEHPEEDRVVLGREADGIEEGRIGDGRLDRLVGPAPDDALQEPVLDPVDLVFRPAVVYYDFVHGYSFGLAVAISRGG